MKLALMQPYFFPYAQQFRHIAQCDRWILFDTVKYSRGTWISRNRIANRDVAWTFISVPLTRKATEGSIASAKIDATKWREEVLRKLCVYKGTAPYYEETRALVKNCLQKGGESIGDLNHTILSAVCEALGITTRLDRLSELCLDLPEEAGAGEWGCLVCRALGADVYSNAPGGRHLFDPLLYERNGVTLEFYEPKPLQYATPGFSFTPDLSVLDSLMWMGAKALGSWCAADEESVG